jgi:hypothetical protein
VHSHDGGNFPKDKNGQNLYDNHGKETNVSASNSKSTESSAGGDWDTDVDDENNSSSFSFSDGGSGPTWSGDESLDGGDDNHHNYDNQNALQEEKYLNGVWGSIPHYDPPSQPNSVPIIMDQTRSHKMPNLEIPENVFL